MESELKAQFTGIILYWIRSRFGKDETTQFPLDIIQLIVNIFLYEDIKILGWNNKYKGTGIELKDDDKSAMTTIERNQYLLCNCDPVTSGIHVWRIKVWFFFIHNF